MFLTVSELNTHLYGELVTEITRFEATEGQTADDNVIAKKAIKAGDEEVKSYLSAFDVDTLFGAAGDNRNEHLLFIVKDVAAWHLISLANPNIDIAFREKRYDDAITWLNRVQQGKVVPSYPYKTDSSSSSGYSTSIKTGSNTPRGTYY